MLSNKKCAKAKRRLQELAAIHVKAKKIQIDREAYVALLTRVAGVTTSANLDSVGRSKVLDELRRLAGETAPAPRAYPGKPHNFASNAMPETITKIEAQLADMKLSWSYADAIANRMFGIERVTWCRRQDQLAAIVAALHVEQEKRGLLERIERMRDELQISAGDWEALTAKLPLGWRRNRRSLRAFADRVEALLAARADEAH